MCHKGKKKSKKFTDLNFVCTFCCTLLRSKALIQNYSFDYTKEMRKFNWEILTTAINVKCPDLFSREV